MRTANPMSTPPGDPAMSTALTLELADGPARSWLFEPTPPSANPPPARHAWPGVLFYMDALGPRPALFGMAQRLADAGYRVLLPDLFYRHGAYGPFSVASFADPVARAALFKLIQETSHEMTVRDTARLLEVLREQGARGPFGAVGYCFGGGRALSAAAHFPQQIAAAASFHGGHLADESAASPHRLAAQIQARIYVGMAGEDSSFPPAQSAALEAALRQAGVDFQLENYARMQHGWTVPDLHGIYDPAGAERHWQRLLALLAESLPSPA
jgi:carboxymethylenebutenolidase